MNIQPIKDIPSDIKDFIKDTFKNLNWFGYIVMAIPILLYAIIISFFIILFAFFDAFCVKED